jgi:hypothetical protein
MRWSLRPRTFLGGPAGENRSALRDTGRLRVEVTTPLIDRHRPLLLETCNVSIRSEPRRAVFGRLASILCEIASPTRSMPTGQPVRS